MDKNVLSCGAVGNRSECDLVSSFVTFDGGAGSRGEAVDYKKVVTSAKLGGSCLEFRKT
ncbi:hypothetical protein [Synechococcus sp. UW69]|uniref:hypothetical protein n=1 Tax=Synechococcus sp. UW69 TaxID=368493 RepID=UPI0014821C02|nr:hypothetical protein [Synechococcus sp. UW69]